MTTKLEQTVDLYKKFCTTLTALTEEDVHRAFVPAFEKFPELRVIAWRQWKSYEKPYSWIQCDYTLILGKNVDSDLSEEEIHKTEVKKLEKRSTWGLETTEIERVLSPVFELLTEDICCRLFGTDAQVIITKNKISSNTYYPE